MSRFSSGCERGEAIVTTPSKALETFPNPEPGRDYTIDFTCPEFTSLCPMTGQLEFRQPAGGQLRSNRSGERMVIAQSDLTLTQLMIIGLLLHNST